MNHQQDYESASVRQLRADLALALRAAYHYGLSEGVCNHFSAELPDGSGRFLLNPRGLLWSEVGTDDIGMRYSVEIPDTTLGRDLQVLIARGDVFGSSFAFAIAGKDGESWSEEDGQAVRYVHEVDGVYDVSPVLSPAYEDATASVVVRSYERYLQSHRPALKLPELRRDAKSEKAIRRFLRQHGHKVG